MEKALDALEAVRQEFAWLLQALGATGQDNLTLEQLGRVSFGYRRWLHNNPEKGRVMSKQFWYAVVQTAMPNGEIGVAQLVLDEHPLLWLKKRHTAGVPTFITEIPEEVYAALSGGAKSSIIH
jgi:hypothetical protein